MTDGLLGYYQRELAFIRKMGAEFAEDHKDVAAGLLLGADAAKDPHVERLIMAFAFLAARIRRKLDDDFPEITSALLGVLYPHYLAPIPSMAIAEFQLQRSRGDLTKGYQIDAGRILETRPVGGVRCTFRTCYPVTLWPFEVIAGSTEGGVVRIKLRCFSKEATFSTFELSQMRMYLKGDDPTVLKLYELLFNNVRDVTLVDAQRPDKSVSLEPAQLRPVGFDDSHALLPQSKRSFPGYRLLTEYFAFHQKFCFFDLVGLTPGLLSGFSGEVELRMRLDRQVQELVGPVDHNTFRLGCTPVINLFPQPAEPIALTHLESDYRINPDARRGSTTEIYSVDKVTGTSPSGETVEYRPLYSLEHGGRQSAPMRYWQSTRRPSMRGQGGVGHGTEVYLSLVDLGLDLKAPADWTVDVKTTCMNRDLPNELPFGGDALELQSAEGGPFASIRCVTKPTRTIRPDLGQGVAWKIISHLTLNHLSITDEPEALKDILRLYNHTRRPETESKIAGIHRLSSGSIVRPIPDVSPTGFARGVEVRLEFDESQYSDNGMFLFASVLEYFLGLYCSINSFTQLVISTRGKPDKRLKTWPPRAGRRILL